MTIGTLLLWIVGFIVATILGAYGGVLLIISRAIDNTRAAIRCAGMALGAARGEWVRNWSSCQGWAKHNR